MFKEVLQIIPQISSGDLGKMEKSLSSRFGNVAKKFGKGLLASLAGGGIAGAALGLVDKLLNPLKETQEAIDKALKQGDEIVTNAKQFGTSAGKLFRLQQIAKSTGLDESSTNILLEKFQTALANAAANPTKPSSVSQFVGAKDTAEAFFEFIQGMQKLNKTQQVLVQQDVFGEKLILRMADFVQTDFAKQTKLIGGPSAETLTPGLEKLGSLNDLKDALEARRTLNDTLKKSKVINEAMVKSQDEQAKLALDKENKQIQSYSDLAAISVASNQILNIVNDGILKVTSILVKLTNLTENINKITGSRLLRGIFGKSGD